MLSHFSRLRCFCCLIGVAWLAGPVLAPAQARLGSVTPSASKLKHDIQALRDYDNMATPELDIDSAATETARALTRYLKAHELSAAEAEKLGLELSVDSEDAFHLHVYTCGYTSGGTRGGVSVPVLQWRNQAGQLAAYPLPVACTFNEIHKLASPGRTLYLLLGDERLNAPSMLNQAFVIELKGKYVLLDNPVFGRSPLLPLCNTDMEFDEIKQVLHLDLTNYEPAQQGDNPLERWGLRGIPTSKKMSLKFSAGHFVKSR